MASIILKPAMGYNEKLKLMNASAKYDVSDREADSYIFSCLPDVENIKAPTSPPKVPKLFMSNNCTFNCAYCGCRCSNDITKRYVVPPGELADIAVREAKNNGHGIFITSAIYKNSDYTVELIIETLRLIRKIHRYTGYVHAKIMPGTDFQLIDEAGLLADRLSVNIELPKSDGYALIAKQKNKKNILTPISYMSYCIKQSENEMSVYGQKFARSGITTQMMVGTMKETDRTILILSEALYRKYNLRRIYYSAFHPVQECEYLPSEPTPQWRTRRLYQADRLLQLYGFQSSDLFPESYPNLDFDIDPKAAWALRNLHLFPVEVNTADYEMLIRIPGIGITYAKKILKARKTHRLTHDLLLKMHVSTKRAQYFITCDGKYTGGNFLGNPQLRKKLSDQKDV